MLGCLLYRLAGYIRLFIVYPSIHPSSNSYIELYRERDAQWQKGWCRGGGPKSVSSRLFRAGRGLLDTPSSSRLAASGGGGGGGGGGPAPMSSTGSYSADIRP